MTAQRISLWAAFAAVTIWALKAAAIGIAGGPGRSPFEDVLFFAGLLAFLVAVVSFGIAVTRGARLWVRVLVGVGILAAGMGLTLLVEAIRGAAGGTHWIWGEVNLWVSALVVLAAVGVLALVRTGRGASV